MSGIFDKYLNLINGSRNTYGQMHTRTNTTASIVTINGKEHYIPYKKTRRSSSVASTISENDANAIDEMRKGSIGSVSSADAVVVPEVPKKVLREPNNRVNF